MDICQELIDEIHARDLKVVFDMVMNHISDQHPWFLDLNIAAIIPNVIGIFGGMGKNRMEKRLRINGGQ